MEHFRASVNDFVETHAKNAKFAIRVAKFVGNEIRKGLAPGYYGLCATCHNLRPHRYVPGVDNGTSLFVEEISTKEILNARKIDAQTGHPKNDCRYCRLLYDIFDTFFVDEYMDWKTETMNGMDLQFGLMIREGQPLIINCTDFTWEKHDAHPRVDIEPFVNLETGVPPEHLADAPCMGPTGVRQMNPRSPDSTKFVKEAVFECLTEHPMCQTSPGNFVPSRLLSLGASTGDLKLCTHFDSTQSITWAALSHCWGDENPIKLTGNNITSFKQSIRFVDLPATFHDSIVLARDLGIQYIWIDSLCIIQDDTADWRREAARMGQVYSEAFVVILAASSPGSSFSFLIPRSQDWSCKTVNLELKDGGHMPITFRRKSILAHDPEQGKLDPPYTESWAYLKRDGPLYGRGWCWQEAFMARRALHFAPGAIVFECKTHRRCQDELPPYPCTTPGTLGEVSDLRQWHMIVKSYTSRQLTFGRDRLPAIGGAAQDMPQASRSQYLAGLWRESLLLDLMWQIMPGYTRSVLRYADNEQQMAPSWSWASVRCGVVWDEYVSPTLLAEVISARLDTSGTEVYGQVDGGHLVIRGRVLTCTYTTNDSKLEYWVEYTRPNGSKCKRRNVRVDGGLAISPEGSPHHPCLYRASHRSEFPPSSRDNQGLALFLCLAKTPRYEHMGLLLSPSRTKPECFERVGRVLNLAQHWYTDGIESTVAII